MKWSSDQVGRSPSVAPGTSLRHISLGKEGGREEEGARSQVLWSADGNRTRLCLVAEEGPWSLPGSIFCMTLNVKLGLNFP